ncbi:DUF554 domain-containing protein [Peptoniphilus harei]|uniref:DUF554 domain-containing protein n=1 Tax=Peptoniphilus harei TaxID=54005 RepID=UPI00258664B3|nr:DUF554 domain-containing protein [Peptoniphilus harei]MDU6743371.1 DUF554 domain-containing protein [Peptoniphilus harei]
MLGVLVNAITVLILGLLGSLVVDRFPEKTKDSIMKFLPLCILTVGIKSALEGNAIVMIVSIVIGLIIGEAINIEDRIETFADFLIRKFVKDQDENFAESFISAGLIFCIGSMTILGSIEAGVRGNNEILLIKSLMDGLTAFFLAATFGRGVAFSALPVFIYQALMVFLSGFLLPIFTAEVAANLSGTGGVIIIAICLSMLKLVDFKIANSMPAIFIPLIYGRF